jgi:hypothetical protein
MPLSLERFVDKMEALGYLFEDEDPAEIYRAWISKSSPTSDEYLHWVAGKNNLAWPKCG